MSEREFAPASTGHKDMTGTVSVDFDATYQGEPWQYVDGYVTWAMDASFIRGSAHVSLLLFPVESDHNVDQIMARARSAGELHMYWRTLDPMPVEDFFAVFSQGAIALTHKSVPDGVRVVPIGNLDEEQ